MSVHEPNGLAADHTPAAIAARIAADPKQAYLRDFIYGSIDGLVTTFAIVTGALGAGLSTSIIVVLGFVNLLADGFSMAVSNFLGTKADRQMVERARLIEERHVDEIPDGEAEEVHEIYRRKGFEGDLLDRIVQVITGDRQLWIETMLREEWGLALHGPSPRKAALVTMGSFVFVGLIPVLPFLVFTNAGGDRGHFAISAASTAIAFFGVGALKSQSTPGPWYRAGLETLLMGGAAAVLAWIVGAALRGFV
ncbi:MAG: VIT1/CCC1 transporter family protein [Planctomycetaceae bacterium]